MNSTTFPTLVRSVPCARWLVLLSCFFAAVAHAAPGDLDPTFGAGGIARLELGDYDYAEAATQQGDGRVVVAGTSGNRFWAARYLTNGTLDLTFNGTGYSFVSIPSPEVRGVAVQDDGGVVVVGRQIVSGDVNIAVVRFTANGTADSAFNGTGTVVTPVGPYDDYGRGVAIQEDGKIVVAGIANTFSTSYEPVLLRYTANGTLDTTFNGTGVVQFAGGPSIDFGEALALQDDGSIVLAGNVGGDLFAARVLSNGTLDTTFNGTGVVITPSPAGSEGFLAVTVGPNGTIVGAGRSEVAGDEDFLAVRYLSNGTLDTTFNGTGLARVSLGGAEPVDRAWGVGVLADGRVVMGGSWNGTGLYPRKSFAAVRLLSNGTLDTTFNGTGIARASVAEGEESRGAFVQADGRVVVVGDFYVGGQWDAAVVRFGFDGGLDASFNGTGGKVVTVIGSGEDSANAIAIQPDGRIVVAGYTFGGNGTEWCIARYTSSGALDPSFNGNGVVTIGGVFDRASAVAISGNEIVVAGRLNSGGSDIGVARLTANGSMDTSFNGTGTAAVSIGTTDVPSALAVQADGAIIVGGRSDLTPFVARFLANGTLDPGFSGDGIHLAAGSGDITDLAIDGEDRIVATGFDVMSPGYLTVTRLLANGTLDSSFDADGIFSYSGGGGIGLNKVKVALYGDGGILIAGTYDGYGTDDLLLLRLTSNGSWDASFNGAGTAVVLASGEEVAWDVAIADTGKIIVAGSRNTGGNFQFLMVRLHAYGALDSTFGTNGTVTTNFSGVENSIAHGLALQADGRIVLAGTTNSTSTGYDFALARYLVGAPEIDVGYIAGYSWVSLADGSGNITIGAPVGASYDEWVHIQNLGTELLTGLGITIDGPDAGSFAITTNATSPVPGPTGYTTFVLQFTGSGSGVKTANLHIASNDPDEHPFDIQLIGKVLTASEDTDGDGASDELEFNLSSLGLHWQVDESPGIVDDLVNNAALLAPLLDLYSESQLQALKPGAPWISRDSGTGNFVLTMDWKKSTNLVNFTDFPAAPAGVSVNPDGNIEFEFASPDDAAFFRLEFD